MTRRDLAGRWPLAGSADAEALRDELLAAYDGPRRGYHDLTHLGEVLDRLDELAAAGEAFDATTVRLAAWFHDAVHEGDGDDEERSADWARRALAGIAGPGAAAETTRLVLLTATHAPAAGDAGGAALCDADLAILAAGPERYAAYAAGVRAEYPTVPDAAFTAGRAAVLSDLADRPVLFSTSHARRFWERPARANLRREIDRLLASGT